MSSMHFDGGGYRRGRYIERRAGSARDGDAATQSPSSTDSNIQSQGDDHGNPRIGTRDEWMAARKDLLVKEKALTRAHDALSAERRRLPMVKIEKNYVFETPSGKRTLAELFDGKSQLIVYHFMMGPDWTKAVQAARSSPTPSTAASSISRTATSR